jgi:hypothetical protein
VQELLGHRDVRTTMIYTHVLDRGPGAVRSPLDAMAAGERQAAGRLGARYAVEARSLTRWVPVPSGGGKRRK